MRNTKHLSREQIRKLMLEPLTQEESDQLRKIRQADKWLLALNIKNIESREVRSRTTLIFRQIQESSVDGKSKDILIAEEEIISEAAGARKPYFPKQLPIKMFFADKDKKRGKPYIKFEYKKDDRVWMVSLVHVINENRKFVELIIVYADGEVVTLQGKDILDDGRWKLSLNKPAIEIYLIKRLKEDPGE